MKYLEPIKNFTNLRGKVQNSQEKLDNHQTIKMNILKKSHSQIILFKGNPIISFPEKTFNTKDTVYNNGLIQFKFYNNSNEKNIDSKTLSYKDSSPTRISKANSQQINLRKQEGEGKSMCSIKKIALPMINSYNLNG